ncbi:MAG: acyl-ACP--UDP-N-acetylglucosamine O-acyltransferase [Terriglobales bacterium]
MPIAPTATIAPGARIPDSCIVGPGCVIGAEVEMGEHCRLEAHVVLEGPTRLGAHNHIYPFTTVGLAPQDLSYRGEPTRLEIGERNTIREFCSLHRGTVKGGGLTRIGSGNLLMAYAHVAHDCFVGDGCILANCATLGGHVLVGDFATVGAFSPVHQYVRIGPHAFVGGGTVVTQDVLPYSKTVARREARAYGINRLGLERRGFKGETLAALQRAFRLLLNSGLNTTQALERIHAQISAEQLPENHPVAQLAAFIAASERGVIK